VKLLLAHKANATLAAMDAMTALHFAAGRGHAEAARHLLNAGARARAPAASSLQPPPPPPPPPSPLPPPAFPAAPQRRCRPASLLAPASPPDGTPQA
jgi:hypothetical protein